MGKRRNRLNQGFSFVELLVAVAILGIISLPITSSFVLAARIDAKATAVSAANNAADDVLLLITEFGIEKCQDAGYFKIASENVDESENEGEREYQLQYGAYVVNLKLTDFSGFTRVDVCLFYTADGSTQQILRKGVLCHERCS